MKEVKEIKSKIEFHENALKELKQRQKENKTRDEMQEQALNEVIYSRETFIAALKWVLE